MVKIESPLTKSVNFPCTKPVKLRDTTFLIPFRSSDKTRIENLKFILQYLNAIIKDPIILVIEFSPKDSLPTDIPHHWIHCTDTVFHKTKYVNKGLRKVTTPYVCIQDYDCFMLPSQYAIAEKRMHRSIAHIPYSVLIKLDATSSKMVRKHGAQYLYGTEAEIYTRFYGGLVFYNVKALMAKGGFNKHITLGAEDDEVLCRLRHFGRVSDQPGALFHLFHKPSLWWEHQSYRRNRRIYSKTLRMSKKQVERYIQKELVKH